MKRILTVQDISCVGKCSLTVALPLISAMGTEAAILPTAVLSTHTNFQGFTCKDLTDQIVPITNHWKNQNFKFDAIYTGYLSSPQQADLVCNLFDDFKTNDNFIFADPAMADNGRLYPAFDKDFPKQMAKVCAKADIIVPNLTEACLMTNTEYKTDYDKSYIDDILQKLINIGAKKVALTGTQYDGKYGITGFDSEKGCSFAYYHQKLAHSYHGTGDVFSSICVGAVTQGKSLQQAIKIAADFTVKAIEITSQNHGSNAYGVDFEQAIPYLVNNLL